MGKSKSVTAGMQRFTLLLNRLVPLLEASVRSVHPGQALFESPARQHLFYLEALARIYRKTGEKKIFSGLRDEFKALEDQLGKIDFYDAWVKEFSSYENFPPALLEYFKANAEEESAKLTALLHEKKWIGDDHSMMRNIEEQLNKAEWLSPEEDKEAISVFLDEELDDVISDFDEGKYDFTQIETGVHEFRRDVRWFSIYSQALNGLIQLKQETVINPLFEKYMAEEIKNSPYNQLPPFDLPITPVFVAAPHFYALSWFIAESGRLKDAGLRMHALTEAIISTGLATGAAAEHLAGTFVPKDEETLNEISHKMQIMTDRFMNQEQVLRLIRSDIQNR